MAEETTTQDIPATGDPTLDGALSFIKGLMGVGAALADAATTEPEGSYARMFYEISSSNHFLIADWATGHFALVGYGE